MYIFLIQVFFTKGVRKKQDVIFKAFENYIDGQNYFDIFYSPKIGYVWIVVDHSSDAGAEQLDTPGAMLDHFFNDVINDVIAPRESVSLTEAHSLTEQEDAEVRRQLTAILETIEDGADEYLDYLDEYIRDYQDGCCED